jgi:virulence-associated protein VagC
MSDDNQNQGPNWPLLIGFSGACVALLGAGTFVSLKYQEATTRFLNDQWTGVQQQWNKCTNPSPSPAPIPSPTLTPSSTIPVPANTQLSSTTLTVFATGRTQVFEPGSNSTENLVSIGEDVQEKQLIQQAVQNNNNLRMVLDENTYHQQIVTSIQLSYNNKSGGKNKNGFGINICTEYSDITLAIWPSKDQVQTTFINVEPNNNIYNSCNNLTGSYLQLKTSISVVKNTPFYEKLGQNIR